MKKLFAVVVALVLGSVLSGQANLLLNSSFETQDGTSEWLAQNWWRDNTGVFADMVDRNNWHPNSGTWDMLVKGWEVSKSGRFGQWVGSSFGVGDVFTFSIYGDCEADFTASDVRLGIEFHSAGGVVTNSTSIYSSFLGSPGTFGQYTFKVTNTQSGVYGVSAFVLVDNTTGGAGSRSVYFDDASLTIPEPTVAGLLGVAGLMFAGLRRRLKK